MKPTTLAIQGTRRPAAATLPTFGLIMLMIIASISQAEATDRDTGGPSTNEPNITLVLVHHSFVRDGKGNIMARDNKYASDVKARQTSRYKYIDVVMQQCFGGGFKNDIATLGANYTFGSAANWDETAKNIDSYDAPTRTYTVNNFTRAWREDAMRVPANGMLGHFDTAATGRAVAPVIAKDPYARVTTQATEERPQYRSPDATTPGANDSRVISSNRQFVILASWSASYERHKINIGRMYHTLTNIYHVPKTNIAVLIDSPAPATLGSWAKVQPGDAGGLPAVNVNASNERANWLKALDGSYFGNQPVQSNDRLLIYNTGHGAHLVEITMAFVTWEVILTSLSANHGNKPSYAGQTDRILQWKFSRTNGFDSSFASDTTNPGSNDTVRLYFEKPLPRTARLRINSLESWDSFVTPDPSRWPLYSRLVSYRVSIPHEAFTYDDVTVEIEDDAQLPPDDSRLLVAVDLQGGDQEFLAINGTGEPNLSIEPDSPASQIRLWWPDMARGYYVESSTNLADPDSWAGLTNTVTRTNGQYAVPVELGNTARFFRLNCEVGDGREIPVEYNPVLYLPFDEGAETNVFDVSTNHNDGTLAGAVWTDGYTGSALEFSGGGQYYDGDAVRVPHSPSLDITNAFSIEAWIKPRGTDPSLAIVDKYRNAGSYDYGFTLLLNSGRLHLVVFSGENGSMGVMGVTDLRDNAWHHVRGMWDGADLLVYVDGQLEGQVPWAYPPASTTQDLGIGKRLSGSDGFMPFMGLIDEVVVSPLIPPP